VLKKDSFVGRFKNKGYIRVRKNKKKNQSDVPNGKLYGHLCLIHCCKTDLQRAAVMDLIVGHWREALEEHEAADLFLKSYGRDPFLKWNYNCTGEVGVYPSNCPSESYNHHCVKGSSVLNLSLPVYLVEKMPAMLEEEALLRSDPCTIEIPRWCDNLCLVVHTLYKAGRDVLVRKTDADGIPNSWTIALCHNVGRQITGTDLYLLDMAEQGNVNPFLNACKEKKPNCTKADVASSMVERTRGYCRVRIRDDGIIVGDCEECVKHLGYRCPAVNYIRSKYGQLEGGVNVLENGVRVILNKQGRVRSNQRITKNMYTSGLCSKSFLKSSKATTFQDDCAEFFTTLSEEEAFDACLWLKLDDWCYLPPEEIKVRDSIIDRDLCIRLLQEYQSDPVGFRMNRDAQRSKKKVASKKEPQAQSN